MAPPRGSRGRKPAVAPVVVAQEKAAESPKDPLDFETLDLDSLRKYRSYYNLNVPSPMTLNGYMVHAGVGKLTSTAKKNDRVSKREVAAVVKDHFLNEGVRESETIVDFVYAIQNKDKVFKLQW